MAGWMAAWSLQRGTRRAVIYVLLAIRAGLCCGVVLLQPRPHAAVHTRSIEDPTFAPPEAVAGLAVVASGNRVARQRACVRVGVSHLQMGSQAHVSYGFVTLNYWESPLSREFAEVIGNACPTYDASLELI